CAKTSQQVRYKALNRYASTIYDTGVVMKTVISHGSTREANSGLHTEQGIDERSPLCGAYIESIVFQ
ncbi:MAG: hypothetical protein KDE54_22710, partial [Caldilineaceae bacterium]|nr:hypothetical protein [Caldilineaceae bacterium]